MERDFEYDLSASLPTLRERGDQTELVTAIERALWVASAHQDLSDAAEALDLLKRITKSAFDGRLDPSDRTTVAGCLFSQAIISYARATETPPIDRGAWFGRSKLKDEMLETHVLAMTLRNKALAHFGRADLLPEGALVREALVLRRIPEGVGISFYSSRAQNRANPARRIARLVDHVRKLAFDATQARYAELGTALSRASARDPGLPKLMRGFPFDSTTVFADDEWIEQFRQAAPTGAFTGHGAITRLDE